MALMYGTLVFVLLMLLAPAAAAQEPEGPDQVRVGLSGVVMPGDEHNPGGPGPSLGVLPTFDLQVGRRFFIGVGPQVSVKPRTSASNSSSLVVVDLLFRLGWVWPTSERVQVYGYLAPGYSAIFRADRTFKVPTVGAHLGGALALGDRVFATLQLGYQTAWILDLGDSPRFLNRPALAVGLVMQL